MPALAGSNARRRPATRREAQSRSPASRSGRGREKERGGLGWGQRSAGALGGPAEAYVPGFRSGCFFKARVRMGDGGTPYYVTSARTES